MVNSIQQIYILATGQPAAANVQAAGNAPAAANAPADFPKPDWLSTKKPLPSSAV